MRVLVTGAGALLGQGVIRCLRASDLEPHIIAADPSPLSAGLYWADSHHLIALARDPAFLDSLRRVLERERPEILIPGTDAELRILAENRAALESEFGVKVLVSDPEVVAIADDKYLTYRFLRDHGFPHPATCLPGEEEGMITQVGFPLVVKPRVGARSVGVRLCVEPSELRRALDEGEGDLVIQEAVAGPEVEFTAGSLTFGGRCRATIVMRRELRDGNTYRAWVEPFPHLNQRVRELADALRAFGPANFQFRLDGDDVKVFEINARFSGTTPLRRHAGFDEVTLCLRHLLRGEPVTQPVLHPVTILRHWSETVVSPDQLGGR